MATLYSPYALSQSVILAKTFEDLIKASPVFEMAAPRSASLVCFRLAPTQTPPHFPVLSNAADSLPSPPATPTTDLSMSFPPSSPDANTLNADFYRRLIHHPTHQVFVSSTVLRGVFCIRMAIGGVQTAELHVRKAFENLCLVAREM